MITSKYLFDGLDPEHFFNQQYRRHVLYEDTNDRLKNQLFSEPIFQTIQQKLTELLYGLYNRPIIVPFERIADVMDEIYTNYRPTTGDIYTRYIVPSGQPTRDDYIGSVIDQTIETIYASITNEVIMQQTNAKLSVWNTLLGEGVNEQGLRPHQDIKLRERRPKPMFFAETY